MSTQAIILSGVAIYMLAMLAVGYLASKRTHSVAEFMVAGRGLPVWLCSITVIATWFGGAMMLGGAGAAYDEGMMGVIEDPWGGALALLAIMNDPGIDQDEIPKLLELSEKAMVRKS